MSKTMAVLVFLWGTFGCGSPTTLQVKGGYQDSPTGPSYNGEVCIVFGSSIACGKPVSLDPAIPLDPAPPK